MSSQNSWHRAFSGTMQDIGTAMRCVRSIAAELELPRAKANDIQVCLEELMTNIVRHGQQANPLTIALSLNSYEDGIIMTVEDNGDVMMPGMDGFEVCRCLKENPETRNIPVIFLTGKTDPIDEVKGFEAEGNDYIKNPSRPKSYWRGSRRSLP